MLVVLAGTTGPEGAGMLSFGGMGRPGGDREADVPSHGGAGVVEPSSIAAGILSGDCLVSFLHVPSSPTVENRQLTLDLQTENKGSVVSGGELTIFLDGPAVDLGSLPNGSAVTEGECRPSPHARGSSEHEAVSSSGERSGAESTALRTSEQASECQQPHPLPGKAPAPAHPNSGLVHGLPQERACGGTGAGASTGSRPASSLV